LVDLYGEIALSDKRVLFSGQKISHEEALKHDSIEELHLHVISAKKLELTRAGFGSLEKEFEKIGLVLVSDVDVANEGERDSILSRLRTAGALRNILEHNSGVVNWEFKKLVPESKYEIGDRVIVGTPELGDAISSIEHTADSVNKRAVEKFSLK